MSADGTNNVLSRNLSVPAHADQSFDEAVVTEDMPTAQCPLFVPETFITHGTFRILRFDLCRRALLRFHVSMDSSSLFKK